jgi:ABC-type nitrate/sulfonate/bicarbonate transport system substrate-binding protein
VNKRTRIEVCALLSFFYFIASGTVVAGAEKPFKVRAGYVSPTTDNVLMSIAQKQGFLSKRGIEVEIIALRGGVQVAQALLSNSLQFAEMSGPLVVRSVLSGADLVMVASFVDRISYYLITRPEITSVKDLVGKKIASSSIGGSVDMVLRLGLKDIGVDPKSITILSAGTPEARLAALTSGQMAATALLPEHLVVVEKAGLKVFKDLSEVDVHIQHTGLVVRRSLIKENRPLVKNFLAAIVDAIDFYRTHERESIEIIAKFTSIKDPRALKDSYEFHKRLFPQPPYPNRDGFRTLLSEIGDKATEGKNVTPDLFFDRTLLEEIKDR